MKRLRDNIKTAIYLDPVVRPRKMFEEQVDKIRDTLGKHVYHNYLAFYQYLSFQGPLKGQNLISSALCIISSSEPFNFGKDSASQGSNEYQVCF